MSVKPPINCPPDYSILAFRLTECKKASVVKGVTPLASLDLNSLAIPIKYHSEGSMILKANSTKLFDIDSISENWPLNETYGFRVNETLFPNAISDGTSHEYTLYDEELNSIESISFTINSSDPNYADFWTALNTAYNNSTTIKTLVSFVNYKTALYTTPLSNTDSAMLLEDGSSLLLETGGVLMIQTQFTLSTFDVKAKTKNIKYRHVFNFDTTGVGGLGPYLHPGNLIMPYTKYPKGRVKYMLIYPQYDSVDTTTCGCADSSGFMKSNQKFFQYSHQEEYDELTNVSTPIILDGGVLGENSITWNQISVDHIGYHLKVGDLISTVENPLFRAYVTDINGYEILLDQVITNDLTVSDQQVQHTYSPTKPRWRNIGDFFFLSGATDVTDSDKCYIESIVLKNPHSFDIPLKYMIGR